MLCAARSWVESMWFVGRLVSGYVVSDELVLAGSGMCSGGLYSRHAAGKCNTFLAAECKSARGAPCF